MIANGEALKLDAVRGMIRAFESVGGAEAIANGLGETLHRVNCWREIPVRHLLATEALTGIPRHELRPDIDWSAMPDDDEYTGVDVTDMLGIDREVDAFNAYRLAFRKNEAEPNLPNARALVAAWNAFADVMGIERA